MALRWCFHGSDPESRPAFFPQSPSPNSALNWWRLRGVSSVSSTASPGKIQPLTSYISLPYRWLPLSFNILSMIITFIVSSGIHFWRSFWFFSAINKSPSVSVLPRGFGSLKPLFWGPEAGCVCTRSWEARSRAALRARCVPAQRRFLGKS